MKNFSLILVNGPPATGKTTLAREIAKELKLPLISRDDIKSLMLDEWGWKDRQWSKKIGKLSYRLLDYMIQKSLEARHSLVVESAFNPVYENSKFQKWQNDYDFNCTQVFCYADSDTILNRWLTRGDEDQSHPSHTEGEEGLEDLKRGLERGEYGALELRGALIKADTSDFTKVNNTEIINKVKASI